MQSKTSARIAAACGIVLCTGVAFAGGDDPNRILLPPPDYDNIGPREVSMLMSGFEQGEGWNLGLASNNTPAGWAVLGANASPIISNLNPWVGAQHLRIQDEPGVGSNNDVGILSPNIKLPGEDELEMLTLKMGVYISEKGGADYDVFLQSESALAARVKFDFSGRILIVDDLAFRDTGVEWSVAEWKELRIELDYTGAGQATAKYYYGGTLIYEDNNRFDLVDDPTQFGIVSDNNHKDDFGDFDNVMLVVPTPGALATALVGGVLIGARRRRR